MPVNNPPPASGGGGGTTLSVDGNGYTIGIPGFPPVRLTIEDDGVQVITTLAAWDATAGKERVLATVQESD